MPEATPTRPALWPRARLVRVALLCLLAFALLRGLLMGLTIPHFWGPDEDYHFLYGHYLAHEHALPSPDKPLYPREYGLATDAIVYDAYCCGANEGIFVGDPRRSIEETSGLPDSAREPRETGRGVGVIHPPLYHSTVAVVDAIGGDASILTRVTWVRFVTALFGVLAIYAAWLLAAQVLRDSRLQLLAAFMVAVQPMVAYLAGIVNHDSALIAFCTLATAMMLFILRSPPRMAQGAWLGGCLVLALFVKGSALALLPVAGVAYLGQWLVHRGQLREVLRSAALAAGLVLVLAGWWYIRSRIVYGSATGAASSATTGEGGFPGLGDLLTWTKEWTGLTYRTYWWHYVFFSAPGPSPSKYIPALLGAVGMLGLAFLGARRWRTLFDRDRPLVRQLLLLVLVAFAFYLPFLYIDLMRRADGLSFYVNGGRYLLPAYAGVAVLFLAGVRELVAREARELVFWVVGLVALVFGTFVYLKYSLWFYFGREGISETFRRLTYNRPAFVTEGFLWVLTTLLVAALVGFVASVFRIRRTSDDPTASAPAPATKPYAGVT